MSDKLTPADISSIVEQLREVLIPEIRKEAQDIVAAGAVLTDGKFEPAKDAAAAAEVVESAGQIAIRVGTMVSLSAAALTYLAQTFGLI